jgi:hypothetical protein
MNVTRRRFDPPAPFIQLPEQSVRGAMANWCQRRPIEDAGGFSLHATHLRPKNDDMDGLGPVHGMIVGEYEAVFPLALCNVRFGVRKQFLQLFIFH